MTFFICPAVVEDQDAAAGYSCTIRQCNCFSDGRGAGACWLDTRHNKQSLADKNEPLRSIANLGACPSTQSSNDVEYLVPVLQRDGRIVRMPFTTYEDAMAAARQFVKATGDELMQPAKAEQLRLRGASDV